MILVFATIYGIGQTFFWPCTLGLVSEQFPEGGALTINSIAGVGMLGVGIIGTPFLGNLQDTHVHSALKADQAIYAQYVDTDGEPKRSIFGEYRSVNQEAVAELNSRIEGLEEGDAEHTRLTEEKATLDGLTVEAKSGALRAASGPPVFMFLCYILLILWFASRGGYRPVELKT